MASLFLEKTYQVGKCISSSASFAFSQRKHVCISGDHYLTRWYISKIWIWLVWLFFPKRKQVFLKIEARLVLPISERKQTGCISGDLEWLGADTERPGILLVASRRWSSHFLINVGFNDVLICKCGLTSTSRPCQSTSLRLFSVLHFLHMYFCCKAKCYQFFHHWLSS